MISNNSIITLIAGVKSLLESVNESLTVNDVFLSYLPLAHIFDRVIEECFINHGASIGFWRGDVKLLVEDIAALKPTIFCAVPRVLKRIHSEDPDKTALTEAWKSWMQEHVAATEKVPSGNEPGNTTWVKKAPRKKSNLKLTPGRHVQLTIPLEDLIDRPVKENKVVAFIKGSRSAPLCGFSQRVVAILESQGVDYESVDVFDEEYNNGPRETLKKYSSWILV